MYTCGLRVSEGVNLRLDDIDGKRMVVWARNTKGHRDRSVPLPITKTLNSFIKNTTELNTAMAQKETYT